MTNIAGMQKEDVTDAAFIEGVMGRRVLAWLLDFVFMGMIFVPIFLILTMIGVLTLGFGFAAMVWLPAVPFMYNYLSLLRECSATPGQAILGLTVRRDADLGPPEPLAAFISTLVLYVMIWAWWILWLVPLLTVRHRALQDLASGLVVVRRNALDAWNG